MTTKIEVERPEEACCEEFIYHPEEHKCYDDAARERKFEFVNSEIPEIIVDGELRRVESCVYFSYGLFTFRVID